MESIKKRTSIRKYADREVTEELLNRLLEEAMRTPTMGNLQLYSVVVTRSEEGKKALAPAHFNQPMVTGAPVVLTICADYRRTTLWAENRKGTPGYDNILSFMNAATDALRSTVHGYSSVVSDCTQVRLDQGKVRYVMMPVWLLTVRYGDQAFPFAINGQTGRLAGELPVDKRKYRRLKLSWMLGLEVALALLIAFFL